MAQSIVIPKRVRNLKGKVGSMPPQQDLMHSQKIGRRCASSSTLYFDSKQARTIGSAGKKKTLGEREGLPDKTSGGRKKKKERDKSHDVHLSRSTLRAWRDISQGGTLILRGGVQLKRKLWREGKDKRGKFRKLPDKAGLIQ